MVSVTHNVQNTSSFSYIPKPVLRRLGNSKRIKFTMHDEYITVDRPTINTASQAVPILQENAPALRSGLA